MPEEVVTVELKAFPVMKSLGSFAKVKRIFAKHYGRAGRRVGITLAKRMRRVIRGGTMTANSRLTTAFKRGKRKPLADEGRLFKAITYKVAGVSDLNNKILVGVMRTNEAANVARIVHEGATITVTPRMALLFRAVIAAARGRGAVRSQRGQELLAKFKDNGVSAPRPGTVMVIPPRPFALVVATAPETRTLIVTEYKAAIARAMVELAR